MMSFLWKGKRKQNPLINFYRPSPKREKHIFCLAQSKIPYFNNENDGDSTFFPKVKSLFIKGISLLISREKPVAGSMTVEASIVLPLFFFFFLNVGSAIEMIRLHGNLTLALWNTGNEMAVYGHVFSETDADREEGQMEKQESGSQTEGENALLADIILSGTYVKGRVMDYLGEGYLENAPLRQGADSLLFLESDILRADDTFEIVVTYSVSPVSTLAGFPAFRMANKYYGHLWTGYEIPAEDFAKEEYVYVTENGQVYHLTNTCTHLKLSIRQVNLEEALLSRNNNGEKYEACEKCCEGSSTNTVYITSEGDCYHFQRECSGLKRTIYYVPLSQVEDYRECMRCAGKKKG